MDKQEPLKKGEYIYIFDALRGIAAILIFLDHCMFMKNARITGILFEHLFHNGSFEVVFFFVLSGYCMQKRYGHAFNESISFKKSFSFAVSKVKNFYLLYAITIGYIAVHEVVIRQASIIKTGIKLLLSMTLTQTITIKYWGILNSAAWFLSVLCILYFFTPILTRILNKNRGHKLILWGCMLFYIAANLICYFLNQYSVLANDFLRLITYVFPMYWVPAYIFGMEIVRFPTAEWIENRATKIEVGAVCFATFSYLLGLNIRTGEMDIFRHCLYLIAAACTIVAFSGEKGKISKMLLKSKMRIVGKYSLEIYLIHYPLITRGGTYALQIIPDTNITIVLKMIILFGMTLMLSIIAHSLKRKMR